MRQVIKQIAVKGRVDAIPMIELYHREVEPVTVTREFVLSYGITLTRYATQEEADATAKNWANGPSPCWDSHWEKEWGKTVCVMPVLSPCRVSSDGQDYFLKSPGEWLITEMGSLQVMHADADWLMERYADPADPEWVHAKWIWLRWFEAWLELLKEKVG